MLSGVAKFLRNEEVQLLNQSLVSLGLPPTVSCETRYIISFRLVHQSAVYYSAKYKRVKSRNSYTVFFKDACGTAYGQIQFFVLLSSSVFMLRSLSHYQSLVKFISISPTKALTNKYLHRIVPVKPGSVIDESMSLSQHHH